MLYAKIGPSAPFNIKYNYINRIYNLKTRFPIILDNKTPRDDKNCHLISDCLHAGYSLLIGPN